MAVSAAERAQRPPREKGRGGVSGAAPAAAAADAPPPPPSCAPAMDAEALAAAKAALPFVFECPTTVEAWEALTRGQPAVLQEVVLQRVRACHHLSLAEVGDA